MVFGLGKKSDSTADTVIDGHEVPIEGATNKKDALIRVAATGAGLFSDGYVANVVGSVSSLLALQYGDVYSDSSAVSNLTSIAFVGVVVGQLFLYVTRFTQRWVGVVSVVLTISKRLFGRPLEQSQQSSGFHRHPNHIHGSLCWQLLAW